MKSSCTASSKSHISLVIWDSDYDRPVFHTEVGISHPWAQVFPPSSFALFCHILSHPKSIMSPTLPSQNHDSVCNTADCQLFDHAYECLDSPPGLLNNAIVVQLITLTIQSIVTPHTEWVQRTIYTWHCPILNQTVRWATHSIRRPWVDQDHIYDWESDRPKLSAEKL